MRCPNQRDASKVSALDPKRTWCPWIHSAADRSFAAGTTKHAPGNPSLQICCRRWPQQRPHKAIHLL